MEKETGGSAFPGAGPEYPQPKGMTLRDYFAAHAPDVPDWFKHAAPTPIPLVSDAAVVGDAAHYKAKAERNNWIDEQKAAKFFAWRGFYADCMVAERAK